MFLFIGGGVKKRGGFKLPSFGFKPNTIFCHLFKMKGFIYSSVVVVIFLGLLCFIIYFLPSRVPRIQKRSPYECGFDPLKSARVPFSFRFFLVAILFLLFDLEIALLFPLPFSLSVQLNHLFVVVVSYIFIVVLRVGLIYEWIQGGLDWAS